MQMYKTRYDYELWMHLHIVTCSEDMRVVSRTLPTQTINVNYYYQFVMAIILLFKIKAHRTANLCFEADILHLIYEQIHMIKINLKNCGFRGYFASLYSMKCTIKIIISTQLLLFICTIEFL